MPAWRTMWPGEWRYRAFMLTIGWHISHVAAWFIERGFATQVVHKEPETGWSPWAPVHIAFVRASQGGHVCVMDHIGRVFDPWDISRRTLTHKDYKTVRGIIGIWDINPIKAKAA